MELEFDRDAGVLFLFGGLMVGIGIGFLLGNFNAYSDYTSTYNGVISQDNYEQVMVRESISAYNSSLNQFERNNSEAGFDLVNHGTIHIWGLMKSHDKELYEPVFRQVSTQCFATGSVDTCSSTVEDAISNLQIVQRERFNSSIFGTKGRTA